MSRTTFSSLPADARLWVFACDPAPSAAAVEKLLAATDAYLDQWRAHGSPLTGAREWRYNRFLAVAVDQSTAARESWHNALLAEPADKG